MKTISPLQKHILTELLKSENGLKFSQIKPEEVENDLFNYHLQQLVKKELVINKDHLYQLTLKGQTFVEEENPINPLGDSLHQYKVNVILLLLRENKGEREILVQKRKRHPFYGNVHVPGGNIKKGESIVDAAKRKCREETGLESDFESYGVLRKIRTDQYNDTFSDVFLTVCISDKFSGELVGENSFGENFWTDLDSAIKFEQACTSPSQKLVDIFKFLKDHKYNELPLFIVEERAQLEL